MNLWEIKTDCCGCRACENICPKNCITMEADEEGFLYPIINQNQCINCGLCQKVCPMRNVVGRDGIKKALVMQHKNREVLKASSSGGFFTEVAKNLIATGYSIVGVIFDDEFNVVHVIGKKLEDIEKMRGSKYVQSNLQSIFIEIRKMLLQGERICFVGTPCQVAALKNFLNCEYENLICIDFVCHGVASPAIWKAYVRFLEKAANGRLIEYSFRSKHRGHHNFGTYARFDNGYEYLKDDLSEKKDFMHLAYFNEICSRPSCHSCKFKTVERCTDITMFDCWHVEQFSGIKDNDEGYSTVLIHTNIGLNIVDSIKSFYEWKDVTEKWEDIIRIDGGNAVFSMVPNPKRKRFFTDFSNGMSVNELQSKYLLSNNARIKILRIARKYVIDILKKIGLFGYFRELYYRKSQKRFVNSEGKK